MTRARRALVLWLAALLLAACSGAREGKPGSPRAADADPSAGAVIEPVSRAEWSQMRAAGMVRPECPISRREQLRSVRVNFVDFRGEVQRGQLVVNADVAESVARIFSRLFEIGFPIRRMRPLEEYGGDTNASLRDDNTSGFNCRRADQINAPFRESPHANGRAIDINPRENPWKDLRCRCWFPSAKYKARVEGPGVILRNGPVWRAFREEGWIWQNIDVPDYMHFDTGYPSRPFTGPSGQGLEGTGVNEDRPSLRNERLRSGGASRSESGPAA